MEVYAYQPGRKLNPDAFEVVHKGGLWYVQPAYANKPAQSFKTEAEAQEHSLQARERHRETEKAYRTSQHYKQTQANLGSAAPDTSVQAPAPAPATNPNAVQPGVYTAGRYGVGGRYATFDNVGAVVKMHSSLREAEEYAEILRRADNAAGYVAPEPLTPQSSAPPPPPTPRPMGTAGVQASIPPFNTAAAQVAALGSTSPPAPTPAPVAGTPSVQVNIPPAGNAAGMASFAPGAFQSAVRPSDGNEDSLRARMGWGPRRDWDWGSNRGGTASGNPGSPAKPDATASGRGPLADAFERAFDASIGRAISGAEKIVTGSLDTFKRGWAGIKSTAANPGGTIAALNSTASRAAMGAQIVAAFAAARAKGYIGNAAGGIVSAFSGLGGGLPKSAKGSRGRSSSGRAARAAARAASRATAARRQGTATAYKVARKAGFGQGVSRGFAALAASGVGRFASVAAGGSVALYASALTAIPKALQAIAEHQLDKNRSLAPYSGEMSLGFARLALQDQLRTFQLARSAEGTAATLLGEVNGIRQGQNGIDKLAVGIGNRAGIIAGAMVGPGIREIGGIAEQANNWLDKVDPGGKVAQGGINSIHDALAGAAGWVMGFARTGSFSEANKQLDETIKDLERERANLAQRMQGGDPWALHMGNAANLPAILPARPVPR